MHLRLTHHANEKLRIRGIDVKEIEQIMRKPSRMLYDLLTKRYIAIGPRPTKPSQYLVVVYEKIDNDVEVITAYTTTKVDKVIKSKVEKGRWFEIK
ncbi:MAG: hypothetical protein DRJ40_02725 [Thermoprotei archaeon]|nr:MAG: hypothetical protein DRJ40_02725 [Thermoprotei archaeon]